MYIMRQNMKLGLLTYKHSAYVKQISGRRCWIARIIYDYFYLIEDAYALVEIIYIYIIYTHTSNSCQRKRQFHIQLVGFLVIHLSIHLLIKGVAL